MIEAINTLLLGLVYWVCDNDLFAILIAFVVVSILLFRWEYLDGL